MFPVLLLAAAPLAAGAAAPTLTASHPGFGSATAPDTAYLGLVLGRTTDFDLSGAAPGDVAFLAVATSQPSVPITIGGVELGLDPATLVVVGAETVGAAGGASFGLAPPAGTPAGLPVFAQAAVLSPASGAIALTNATEHATTALAPQVLAEGFQTPHPLGQGPAAALLVTDAAALQAEWNAAGLAGAPPAVDFATRAVFFAFGGKQLTSGYSVDVTGFAPLGPGVAVEQRLNAPGPGCGVLFVETAPFEVVSVDRVAAGLPVQTAQAVVPEAPCP